MCSPRPVTGHLVTFSILYTVRETKEDRHDCAKGWLMYTQDIQSFTCRRRRVKNIGNGKKYQYLWL